MREVGSGDFVFFPYLSESFLRVGLEVGGRMGCLEGLLSLRVSSSSSCSFSLWVGDGGMLNPYEN